MIITIDGPAGTGKSTAAKLLADRLGFIHFDTGAMYRAFTYFVLSRSIDYHDEHKLSRALEEFDFTVRRTEQQKRFFVNGEDVTEAIRQSAVTLEVSQVAAIREIRHKLTAVQKLFGHQNDTVFEGRDLGTVVFPDADLKFYFVADLEIRAQRRFKELAEKESSAGDATGLKEIQEGMEHRDKLDTEREVSPLRQAEDAHLIDTSQLTLEQVVDHMAALVDTVKSSPN